MSSFIETFLEVRDTVISKLICAVMRRGAKSQPEPSPVPPHRSGDWWCQSPSDHLSPPEGYRRKVYLGHLGVDSSDPPSTYGPLFAKASRGGPEALAEGHQYVSVGSRRLLKLPTNKLFVSVKLSDSD